MILDSFDHAEEDFRLRQVAEARVEAESILLHLEKARQNPAWLEISGEERTRIQKLEEELNAAQRGDDYRAIREAVERLNQATTHLAEIMMDAAVTTALRGKTMNEAEAGTQAGGEAPSAPHPFAPAEIK